MRKMTAEQDLGARAELFKALGHPARLLILNLLDIKPRHGEELLRSGMLPSCDACPVMQAYGRRACIYDKVSSVRHP